MILLGCSQSCQRLVSALQDIDSKCCIAAVQLAMTFKYRCELCDGHIEVEGDVLGETILCPLFGIDTRLIPLKEQVKPASPPPRQTAFAAETIKGPVYCMRGQSSSLEVYDVRVVIITDGFISGGSTKTIPFQSITAVLLKKAGLTYGSLQFTIPGGAKSQTGMFVSTDGEFLLGGTRGSNTFTFTLTKLAALKSQGVLSEEEFQAAKKRLING